MNIQTRNFVIFAKSDTVIQSIEVKCAAVMKLPKDHTLM